MVSGTDSSHVYDYSLGRHIIMSGSVDRDSVSVYDDEQNCHITGGGSSFYHHGERCHISLSVAKTSFSGYDYGSNAHFSGNVSGTSVSLFDYEHGQYFNYMV